MSNQVENTMQHHVAHHFDTAEQEFTTAKLGMWIFLVQELLFFGALFVAFFVFKYLYPQMYIEAHHHLSWKMGALNTIFLITSSFTMVMGVRSAQTNQRRATMNYLFATMTLAFCFLVVKYFEYAEKFHLGLLPTHFFSGEGVHQSLPIFFGLYFVMTGLHGIHVLIGIGLIVWLMYRSSKGEFNSEFYTPVEMVGLYWHFVDLVWIFLFPLFYLVG